MINTTKRLCDGRGVGNHANSALDACEISSWNNSRGLVVDATLKTSGAPVHELDGPLSLDGGYGSIDVLGHNVTAVHEAACHVFSMTGVALGHHAGGFKHGVSNLGHRELFVVSLLSGNDWCIRREHEMDAWVGYQVSLELCYIHVQGTVETK